MSLAHVRTVTATMDVGTAPLSDHKVDVIGIAVLAEDCDVRLAT